jgi:hypothetical protein
LPSNEPLVRHRVGGCDQWGSPKLVRIEGKHQTSSTLEVQLVVTFTMHNSSTIRQYKANLAAPIRFAL